MSCIEADLLERSALHLNQTETLDLDERLARIQALTCTLGSLSL
jgi:hypothetical protein